MKASVAVGFCPVECPYCYLNMPYTDGMDVAHPVDARGRDEDEGMQVWIRLQSTAGGGVR